MGLTTLGFDSVTVGPGELLPRVAQRQAVGVGRRGRGQGDGVASHLAGLVRTRVGDHLARRHVDGGGRGGRRVAVGAIPVTAFWVSVTISEKVSVPVVAGIVNVGFCAVVLESVTVVPTGLASTRR